MRVALERRIEWVPDAEELSPMKPEYNFSKGMRGALLPSKGKTRITILIDDEVLSAFRTRAEKAGTGYQTMMNEALQALLSRKPEGPVTEPVLRRVIREEVPKLSRSTVHSGGRGTKRRAADTTVNPVRSQPFVTCYQRGRLNGASHETCAVAYGRNSAKAVL